MQHTNGQTHYGIWCLVTDDWVGEYAPDKDGNDEYVWIPELFTSKRKAEIELDGFSHSSKHKKNYEVRRYISMNYKVRCKKNDHGTYTLTFGRGKVKLHTDLYKAKGSGQWIIEAPRSVHDMKRDAIAAWTEWATSYDPTNLDDIDRAFAPKPGPPSLPKKSSALPVLRKMKNLAPPTARPSHARFVDDQNDVTDGGDNLYLADFLSDKNLFTQNGDTEGLHWSITPLGVLDEVFNYMREKLPFTSRLEYPWVRVTMILQRHFPNDDKYKDVG